MPRYSLNPDRLFDRPWRPGHPFRPRAGRVRRLGMIVLLCVLCAIIFGYNYVTDSDRVRHMAEDYLSRLIGGRVNVKGATLSVFEGLRLDNVTVYVDQDASRPDAELFSARSFVLRYEPRSMLHGQLEATQIIAERPQIHLTQDVQTKRWNLGRLLEHRKLRPEPTPRAAPSRALIMPELLLRNARVEISELREGHRCRRGYLAIDGQLAPEDAGERYRFVLQTRGISDAMGPLVRGTVQLSTGHVKAEMEKFTFGGDVQAMLPEEVSAFWDRHNLSGGVDIPMLELIPPHDHLPATYTIRTELHNVNLAVPPEDWMSGVEVRRHDESRAAAMLLRDAFQVAGFRNRPLPDVLPTVAPSRTGAIAPRAGVGKIVSVAHRDARPPIAPAILPASFDGPHLRTPEPGPAFSTPVDGVAELLQSTPMRLSHVSGSFVFTQDGIDVKTFQAHLEQTGFQISGRINGYRPDATMAMHITSLDGEDLDIPTAPRYLWSLPRDVQDFYRDLQPQGSCRMALEVLRDRVGGTITCGGTVDIVNGQFLYREFKYPLREVNGRVRFGRDPDNGLDWITLTNLRAKGPISGPNENAELTLDGWIGPLGPPGPMLPGLDLRIRGQAMGSDHELFAAFDPDVRDALRILDAPGDGEYPRFRGSFSTHLQRPLGIKKRLSFDTELDITDADVDVAAFPYPLHHLTGRLKIRDGYVDLENVRSNQAGASLTMSGRASWMNEREWAKRLAEHSRKPDEARPETALHVVVNDMPIDGELLAALPPDRREWIQKLGVTGKVDATVELTETPRRTDAQAPSVPPAPAASSDRLAGAADVPPLTHDVLINLHDAKLRPFGGTFEASGVTGKLHLTPDRLDLLQLHGQRGPGALSAAGRITWPHGHTTLALRGTARGLVTEPALRALLPVDARKSWDEVRPTGAVDVDVTFSGAPDVATPADSKHVVSIDLRRDAAHGGSGRDMEQVIALATTRPTSAAGAATAPTSQPTDLTRGLTSLPPGLWAVLRPQGGTATLQSMPYRLDDLRGMIVISPDLVVLRDLSARHGDARLTFSGTGTKGPQGTWDLKLGAADLAVDDALRKALPATLSGLVDSLKLKGTLGVTLSKLVLRPGAAPAPSAAPAAGAPATAPADEAPLDVDLAGTLALGGASLDVGVPMEQVKGGITLNAAIRGGRLDALSGNLDLASFMMGGRQVQNFRATLAKASGKSELSLDRLTGQMAGGDLAGQMLLTYPETGPSRYTMSLAIRNVDVRDLTIDAEDNLSGRVTASLAMEGEWGKPQARRGRGDVVATGKEMYRIPLMLGLVQVTNLALPISSPFKSATARYSIEGEKMTFEKIELRSDTMLMTGEGKLDFGNKQVRMTFVTDNPSGLQVPFLKDLWRGAQHELLRIHVNGTVKEPKVEAGMFGTFTTTVDEVFNGDAPPKREGRSRER